MSALHERWPALRATLPHAALGDGPTPVRQVPALGADVWVKDEASYGDGGWGANKVRKLEWTLADARRRGRSTVLTFGALGTNRGLATALYARDAGLRCALELVDQPVDDHVRAQLERLQRSGATLHRPHTRARTTAACPRPSRAPRRIDPADVDVTRAQLGAGYGHATPASTPALALARNAGLALEPVYTAKALAAVLASRADGSLGGPVVLLQTHGGRS